MLILFALTILVILGFFIFFNKKKTKKKYISLPGPRGLPLVGYLPFLGSDLRRTFKDLADIYGPIFKVRLGTIDCVVVTSPSHAKEILKDQDVIFANRNPTVAGKIATFGALDIALNDYGHEFRKMKKIFVSEMLSNVNFDASYNLRKQHVKKMITTTYTRVGQVVDIGDLMFFTIFNSVMSMVWGNTMKGKHDDNDIHKFRSIMADFMLLMGTLNVSDFLPFLACLDLQGIRRRMKLVADKIEMFLDLAIDNHFALNIVNTHKDLLGYLLEVTKLKDPAKSLSVPQVKAILVDAIVGGMDTTATTVEWVMAELLKHPKIMKIVQEELDETVGLNDTVEEAHIPKLKYLNVVLKETLRLHAPVALLLPHRSSKATTIDGYNVPRNSMVFINTWAIHRDPEFWEDPLEFRPERFLSNSEKFDFSGNQYKYLPFGSGRRMCPGLNLAEKMAMSVLSSMLHCFEWKLPIGNVDFDLSDTFGTVVKKSKPTMAVPTPRLSKMDLYLDE